MYIAKNRIGGKDKVQSFIEKYKFLPMKEFIYGFDEDNNKLYVDYNIYKLESLGDMPVTRNIWCFDKKTGERLWAIDDYPTPNGGIAGPFSSAGFNSETGKMQVFGSMSCRWELDPETGKISNPVFTK